MPAADDRRAREHAQRRESDAHRRRAGYKDPVAAGGGQRDGGPAQAGDGAYAQSLAGRFELIQELGSGSSGTVHRARLTAPYAGLPVGTEVAVKFLRRELVADERAHARLFAEGRLGRVFRHPNVAEIHGFETLDLLGMRTSYLVMQYVQGTTLRDFAARSGAPVEDRFRVDLEDMPVSAARKVRAEARELVPIPVHDSPLEHTPWPDADDEGIGGHRR